MTDFGIIISGQAGQGVQVVSQALGRLLVRHGFHVLATQDVMSRIRGGHNFARLRVSESPVAADADRARMLVALDKPLVEPHLEELTPDAVVLVDDEDGTCVALERTAICIPLRRLARENGGDEVMQNSVALGAAVALLGMDPAPLAALLEETFGRKGEEVVRRNLKCAEAGFRFAQEQGSKAGAVGTKRETRTNGRVLLTGAQAIGLGAISAGVRFVAGYPMSPATPILEYCAAHAGEAGLVVELVEDEIAAANAVQGASFAGARAMACTAGGGFCLMCEALSLAGMTETGIVVAVGMRPGPATGLATRTAQGDLLFAVTAGHGEFPRAVFAPADARQAFKATRKAFTIAERFQTPAIVLFDQFLGDAGWTFDDGSDGAARRGSDDVVARVTPGTKGQIVYVDSDEHSDEGHITESAEVRVRMVNRRNGKTAGIAAEMERPEVWPDANAKELVCCFGSVRGVVREAVGRLRAKGRSVSMVHVCDIWPLPASAVRNLASSSRLLTVEGNRPGQLAALLRQEAGVAVEGTVSRFDGRQFRVGELEQALEERLA